jgi:two-component system chemotaxis sensor kinase CheA
MSLDEAAYQALQETFLDESFEGLDRAEAGLLALEPGSPAELVADMFRAIHSIKGGAGAFGVGEIGGLAHVMESLLDELRRGVRPTPEIRAVLLRGVDMLRRALVDRKAGRVHAPEAHADVCAAIAATLGGAAAPVAAAPVAVAAGAPWRVEFAPHPGLARTGNDALPILRELVALGATDVVADVSRLPALELLEPTEVFLRWTARVPGDVARDVIAEVFAWVDGDCELTIVRDEPVVAAPPAPVAVVAPAAARAPAGRAEPPPTAAAAPAAAAASSSSSVRVGIDKIDLLMNMVGELVITQSMLGELDGDAAPSAERLGRLREGLSLLARNTRALQESVMRLRSMPVGAVFGRLPRLVHDLGLKLGKEVELEVAGETIELDKTVLEKIGDPLVHIVRNSIDHGLEPAADRVAAGKPRHGTIRIAAEHKGSAVVLRISDDGKGLDHARILAVARARGLVAADAVLRDDEIAQLIFAPGFSTAQAVSDVSGRGVGMDVVWRHIKALRGDVRVESVPGKGTTTTLRLPLTLAIIDGQLVRLGDQCYVVPLLSIVETVQAEPARFKPFGSGHVYRLRDQVIPVIDIGAMFGVDRTAAEPADGRRLLMIVEAEGGPLGLLVDELAAQQQVVIKSLESNYGAVDGLAGATILGDGRVAFIMDIAAVARGARVGRAAGPAAFDHAA